MKLKSCLNTPIDDLFIGAADYYGQTVKYFIDEMKGYKKMKKVKTMKQLKKLVKECGCYNGD